MRRRASGNVATSRSPRARGSDCPAEGERRRLWVTLRQRVGLVHELRRAATSRRIYAPRPTAGFALIRSCGMIGRFHRPSSCAPFTARSMRSRPTRYWFSSSSPTGAHAAVAEVVDVVDLAAAVAQLDQHADHREDGRHSPARLAVPRPLGADALIETAFQPARRLVVDLLRDRHGG